jgi:hypothetical protein
MHFLYVAVGESGLVKVGITSKPKKRAYETARAFKKRGDKMVRIKFTPPSIAAFGVESGICSHLAGLAESTTGREWFTGLSFDDTYRHVHDEMIELRAFQIGNPFFLQPTAAA